MINIINKLGAGKNTLTLFIVLIVFYLICFTSLTPVGKSLLGNFPKDMPMLDLLQSYSVEHAYKTLDVFEEKGRSDYLRNLLTIDVILPILYPLALSSLLAYIFSKIRPDFELVKLLALAPFLAGLSDLLENISISVMLLNYPAKITSAAQMANFFTILKNMSLSLTFIILIIELVWLMVKKVTGMVKRS